jgi:integrase
MTKIRLAYVHEFLDRHGTARRYFRKPGFKQVPLPGAPGSDEFMTAYQLALAGQSPRVQVGAGRTRPGSVSAAVVGYYNSLPFRSLAIGTQKMRRAILERFRAEHGDKRIAMLPQEFIVRTLGKRSPAAARNWLKTLRGLLEFAVSEKFRADDPTHGVKLPKLPKSDGIATWTEEEIQAFEAKHPIGSRPRLAFALLLFTAQRRGDVVRMGRQHLRNGAISVRQQKTGASLEIPIHQELQKTFDATPGEHLTFLVTEFGKPFTSAGFGNWFRERCDEAGLKHCSAHGLRKAACRRLAEAGCTAHQIAAISGHASLREVERYTKAVDQARLAKDAINKEQLRTSSGKPGQ